MMNLFDSNEELKKYVCNVIEEVDGEVNLIDKIRVELARVQEYLQNSVIEYDRDLDEWETNMCRVIVAYQAMANCIPALDIVLTPNGYGIVSTTNIAPASKERMERLINAYQYGALKYLYEFSRSLMHSREWWDVHTLRHPLFFGTVHDAALFGRFSSWEDMRQTLAQVEFAARKFEDFLASRVIGPDTMELVRQSVIDTFCSDKNDAIGDDILRRTKDQFARFITRYLRDNAAMPCHHDIDITAIANAFRRNEIIWSAYQSFVDSFASSIITPKKGALYF